MDMKRTALVVAALSFTACQPEPLRLPDEGCQPLLAGADCLLPYPSDFFRVADSSMPGGFAVRHQGSAKPLTIEGVSADANDLRDVDGFSRLPPIVALLGEPVSDAGLVGYFDDKAASLAPSSRTLVIDALTGEHVPHFVDLDPRAIDDWRRAITLRPLVKLAERRRYVVALRGLRAADGERVAATPEGFRRLRDRLGGGDPALAEQQTRYDEDIFPVLSTAGVPRAELQLAWDFTTGADAAVQDDLLRARELALAALEVAPPIVSDIVFLDTEPDPVWRVVFGTVTAPLVLEANRPGEPLARDADGRVRLNGETTFDFTAIIPHSVRDGVSPAPVLHFGHGFFGSQQELDEPAAEGVVEELGVVAFSIDWLGMSGGDLGDVVGNVGNEVWRTPRFAERVPQAMVNWLALTAAIAGPLKDEIAFQRPADHATPNAVVYDDVTTHFLGISQGHILGAIYSALNPAITRSVLHVGGAGLSHMMFRSSAFRRFLFIMGFVVPDALEQQKVMAIMQRQLDPIDPATWSDYLLGSDVPFGPSNHHEDRRALLQAGVADTQVPNAATYRHARMLDIPLVTPAVEEVWGLARVGAPHAGSGLATFDLGVDPGFYANAEALDDPTIVHDELRSHAEVHEQMRVFLTDGKITNPCAGPCSLEPHPVQAE